MERLDIDTLANTKISHSCEPLMESYLELRNLGFEPTIDNFFRKLMTEQPPVARSITEAMLDVALHTDTQQLPKPRYFRQVNIFTVHDYEQALVHYEQFFDAQFRSIAFVHYFFRQFVMQNLRTMGIKFSLENQDNILSRDIILYAVRRRWLERFDDQYVFSHALRRLVTMHSANIVDALELYINEQPLDSYERQCCLGIWIKNVQAGLTPFEIKNDES